MTVESSIEEKITIRPFQVKDCQALSSTQYSNKLRHAQSNIP